MLQLPPIVQGVDAEITRLKLRLSNLRAARKALRADPSTFHSVVQLTQIVWEPELAAQWLSTPLLRFDDLTPLDMVIRGESDKVTNLLWAVKYGHTR